MEEYVGQIWHKLITRSSIQGFPGATVTLDEVRKTVGIVFRAMGGDGGLQIATSHTTENRARRNWIQRIAGTGKAVEYTWRDHETLRLPHSIAVYPERGLNRELYLWLAALAAVASDQKSNWLLRSCRQVQSTLELFPGLSDRYQNLVEAHIKCRPVIETLSSEEQQLEKLIRTALLDPANFHDGMALNDSAVYPVPLWLHPNPPLLPQTVQVQEESADKGGSDQTKNTKQKKRRKAERVEMPDGKNGLLIFRLESLFSWSEYTPVDRTVDDSEDEDAEKTADDLDVMSVARSQETSSSKVRFDLDLPPEDNDDLYLGKGILLPEWDYKKQQLLPDYCNVQPMLAKEAEACELPKHLRGKANLIRAQFAMLMPNRYWFNGQTEGSELDVSAYITHVTDRINGHDSPETGLYRNCRNVNRDMACLLLADLSLSTDSWINNDSRVIDVIRDSMFLFSEALSAIGDRFSIYGFSSRRRNHVRFNTIKTFKEKYNDRVRGRISALEPGYYTRMGAAIRYSTQKLENVTAAQKVLLLLTDGKPNDLDKYEGRYGIEDTRMAIREAEHAGVHPFCVTIDDEAPEYLPYIFGSSSYVLIRKAVELPKKLPMLYAKLTHVI